MINNGYPALLRSNFFLLWQNLKWQKDFWKGAICFPSETGKLLQFEFIPLNFDK